MNTIVRAQLTFQMLTLLKNIYTARASIKNTGQEMSGPDSSNVSSTQHEFEGWCSSPPGRDIFFLKNFDTFTRTSIRASKMNDVSRAQITFQLLTLLRKYIFSLYYLTNQSKKEKLLLTQIL